MKSLPQQRRASRRYRETVDGLPPSWPDVIDVLLEHRSVRKFLPARLPAGSLELMVTAGQSASTSSNKQFWSVVAVEEAARKQRLAALCANQDWMQDAPVLLVWLADLSRMADIAESRGVRLGGLDYLESFLVGALDAALAAQTTAIAAEAMGLGVVYIGAMRDHPVEVARELGLPPRCFAVFGMCVGYPDPTVPTDVKPRLPQSAVLHRERYDTNAWAEPLPRYIAHNNAFRGEQGMKPLGWDVQMIERLRDARALKGRENLRDALARLGFQLK
jgi:nitroreductase